MNTSAITVLILTPLQLEYEAVSRHLNNPKSEVHEGALYEIGQFKGKHHDYTIVIREPGMKNTDMALATERAIQLFKPHIALLVGIAGGVKDLNIGDVAIASSAFNYESGKESEDGFLPRPAEYVFSQELLAFAQLITRSPEWKKRTQDGAPDAKVLIGPVASGDKVVAAVNNSTFERIRQFLSHTKFLEMEAAGFGLAIQRHRQLHALVIRGISDLCADKAHTDTQNWQPVAADRAAGVAMELLWEMQGHSFITTNTMEIKDLVKDIYQVLFPAAIKEIGNDFADAANGDIRALWKKVKPYFIEEVNELAASPEDPDAQADVRNKLKKAVEGDVGLKRELEMLLTEAKKAGSGVTVSGSKNVIVGSTISVGGDLKIGDNNTTNYRGSHDNVGRDKVVQSGNGSVQSSGGSVTINQYYGEPGTKPEKNESVMGKFTYNLPTKMQVDKIYPCTVRIAGSEMPDEWFLLDKESPIIPTKIGRVMRVELVENTIEAKFNIKSISDNEQFLEDDDFTEWIFSVSPIQSGIHVLWIKISVVKIVDNKIEKAKTIVTKDWPVSITTSSTSVKKTDVENFGEYEKMIANGNWDYVIEKLIEVSSTQNNTDFYSEVLQLAGRKEALMKKVRSGQLSVEEERVERNKIVGNLLEILKQYK